MFDEHNLMRNALYSSHSIVVQSGVPVYWTVTENQKIIVANLMLSIPCCINQQTSELANVTFYLFRSKNCNGITGSTHQADTERIIVPALVTSHFHTMWALQIMLSFKRLPICYSPMTSRSPAVLQLNCSRFRSYTANQTISFTSNVIVTWSPKHAFANEFSSWEI